MGKKKSFDWSFKTPSDTSSTSVYSDCSVKTGLTMSSSSSGSSTSSSSSGSSTSSGMCNPQQCGPPCGPPPCLPPCGPPPCLPPIVTFTHKPPDVHHHHINRPAREILIENACKVNNTLPIASSYSPCDHRLAVGHDSVIEIYHDTCCPVAIYNLPSGQTLEVLDFDSGHIIYGSKSGLNLYLTVIKLDTLAVVNTITFVGTSFKSLKFYQCYVLVSYVKGTESVFSVYSYPTLHLVKSYIRCTICPIDFLYICVCHTYLLLVYDNHLELIKDFQELGSITTTPSKILSLTGAYCFDSYNLVVGTQYCTETDEPSILVTPTHTLTTGDTANLRFYYINFEGLFIKGKTHIIGNPESLSVSPNKKTLAMMLGSNLILFDLLKWCNILCGSSVFLGNPSYSTIIWKRNSKFIITNTNSPTYHNLIWFDVSCLE